MHLKNPGDKTNENCAILRRHYTKGRAGEESFIALSKDIFLKVFYSAGDPSSIQQYFKDVRTVFAIGNFDGCHIGHQKLLTRCRSLAKRLGAKAGVLTFSPHPRSYFKPREPVEPIFDSDQKFRSFQELGLDICVQRTFNQEFAELGPEEFFYDYLCKTLSCVGIVVGENFFFGKQRRGDIKLLSEYANTYQVALDVVEPATFSGRTVSSSRLRQAIKRGQLHDVYNMLGRPLLIEGRTEKGRQLGRTIGIPTVNIYPNSPFLLPKAVCAGYGVLLKDSDEPPAIFPNMKDPRLHHAAINIGYKPSISDNLELSVEAHLIDQQLELDAHYNQRLAIYVRHKVRDEQQFRSIEELRQQISQDIGTCRQFLRSQPH